MTGESVSLYFGVEPGKRASLESIARATVEWTEAVRQIAALIDPELEIRIEFVESQDGSVWLSNLIKAVKDGDPKALKSVAFGIIVFFAIGPALHLQADVGDRALEMLGHDHGLSEEDKQDIANLVIEGMQKTNIAEKRKAIVREAENDPAITSLGVDYEPRQTGPRVKIFRHDFPAFGAELTVDLVAPPTEKDTKFKFGLDVEIARANLRKKDPKPRWRFDDHGTEWSADIEDDEFIWALKNEKTGIPLAIGQRMKIDLAIDLVLHGLDWVETNRRVIKVVEPKINRRQTSFLSEE